MGKHVEIVRDLLRALSEGDPDRILVQAADDFVMDLSRSLQVRRVYRGMEEIRAAFAAFRETWSEYRVEPEEVVELGPDRVLAANRIVGRGRGSGVQVTARGAQLWSFESDVPVRMQAHQSREEALRWHRLDRLARARLYFACEARPHGEDPRPLLESALRGEVDIVQLREKRLGDEPLVEAARPFRDAAREHGALFILNDRPDLVASCGADGVHVGQEDLPVAEARRVAGPDALVGLSTHSEEQIQAASQAQDAARPDQVSVGPVWATPTKEGRPATGLGLVGHAARHADLPWFAIGGIAPSNVSEVVAAGGERVVVVRAIRDAADPEAAARALREALDQRVDARS